MKKQSTQFLHVKKDYADQRLDNFLVSRLNGLPKSRLYRLIRKGEIRVNKKRRPPLYRVQAEDIIRIPPLYLQKKSERVKPSTRLQALLTSSIVLENEKILILNKPSGIPVHGGQNIPLGIIEIMQQINQEDTFLELAHRLDRDTSGCLILAKKNSILKELHTLLRMGMINKTYLVLVKGYWPDGLTEISMPLKKQRSPSGEWMVRISQDGKQALTYFRVLTRYVDATLLEVTPKTGRTHQIRVHTQYAKCPIAGDEKYGNKLFNQILNKLGCKRLFLHASEVKFHLLEEKKTILAKASLPNILEKTLAQLTPLTESYSAN